MELSLLVFPLVLASASGVLNVVLYLGLKREKARRAADHTRIEVMIQDLARRVSDGEQLLSSIKATTAPKERLPPLRQPEQGASSTPAADIRPAEAELLAKLARYREKTSSVEPGSEAG